MKKIYLMIFVAVVQIILAETPSEQMARWVKEAKENEISEIQLWEENLAKSGGMAEREKLTFLARGLKNMGARHSYANHSPEVDSIYFRIQREFLRIPGHAQYFADEIEKERAELKADLVNQWSTGSYDRMRWWYLRDTLSNLPSPETIQVLGHYLSDERDIPPPPEPHRDWGITPVNAFIVSETLTLIGLNNPPVYKGTFIDAGVVAKWRDWYDKIKSGRQSFSFRGQNVSYRFLPDGTVQTTPRDPSKDRPDPHVPTASEIADQKKRNVTNWTIVGIIAAAIAMIYAIPRLSFRRKRAA